MTLWQRLKEFFRPPPKPLTWEQADAQAKNWYGVHGWAGQSPGVWPCRVGEGSVTYGEGATYESAFALARFKGKGPRNQKRG